MSEPGTLALVTGASRGLGRALALELARRGVHVIATARTQGALEELDDAIAAFGGACTLVPLDLIDAEGIDRLGGAIFQRWGRLDILAHCAAHAVPLSPVPHVSRGDLEKVFAVNALAVQRLLRSCDALLDAAPAARAVFMTDDKAGKAHWGAYAASKSAGAALAAAYAAEKARSAIRIELFAPPPMPTALRARFYPGEDRSALTRPETVAGEIADRLS